MSKITQEEAEQIKVILEKTFETEAYITSSLNGTIKHIHVNVKRQINKIDTQNLSIIPRYYYLTGYATGIHVRFENEKEENQLGYNSENETFNFVDFKVSNDKILLP